MLARSGLNAVKVPDSIGEDAKAVLNHVKEATEQKLDDSISKEQGAPEKVEEKPESESSEVIDTEGKEI